LIVNRVRVLARNPPTIDESVLAADLGGDRRLAARSIQALEDLRALACRDAESLQRLSRAFDDETPVLVPQLDRDVSDLAGLLAVERFLFAPPRERAALLAEQAF
jgi:predicted secreted protein